MAMRKRKRAPMGEVETPLSSMIDVTFLLLIYFILTQKPIIEDTLFPVDLPSPGSSPPPDKKPTLFTVDVARFYPNDPKKDMDTFGFNQRKVDFKYLQQVLMDTGKKDPEQTVIINCDPNAKHKKLIRVLDACGQAGLTKLNLVNDEAVQFVPDKS